MKISNSEGGGFQTVGSGTYAGVCIRVLDIGTQKTTYGDKRQVVIFWELNELMSDGRPYLVNHYYNATLGVPDKPSKLREHLVAWRSKEFTSEEESGFEIANILGKSCQITMAPSVDGKKTNVKGVAALMKGMPALKPTVEPFMLSADNFSKEKFNSLSEYWQKTMLSAPEYQSVLGGVDEVISGPTVSETKDDDGDDIPF